MSATERIVYAFVLLLLVVALVSVHAKNGELQAAVEKTASAGGAK